MRVKIRAVIRITIPREIGFIVRSIAEDKVISMEDKIININIYRYDNILKKSLLCEFTYSIFLWL